jgi:hypothetical protein
MISLVLCLFSIYPAACLEGRTMEDRKLDRQDALVLALGWLTALLVTLL